MQILTATSAKLAEIIRCRDGPSAAPRQAQKPDSCGPQPPAPVFQTPPACPRSPCGAILASRQPWRFLFRDARRSLWDVHRNVMRLKLVELHKAILRSIHGHVSRDCPICRLLLPVCTYTREPKLTLMRYLVSVNFYRRAGSENESTRAISTKDGEHDRRFFNSSRLPCRRR
jgi:hypothetical protein